MRHDEQESVVLPDGWDTYEWSLYSRRETWPKARDLAFLPDVVARLSDAIWSSDDVDLANVRARIDTDPADQWRVGVLWTMVNLLTPLIVDGSLTVHVALSGSTGIRPLGGHHWTEDEVARSVAEGVLALPRAETGTTDNWVFLDELEAELLLLVYSPVSGESTDQLENLRRRHHALADVISENIAAIAGSQRLQLRRRAGAVLARTSQNGDPTPWELDALFADAPRVLTGKHQLKLIDRVAEWFRARFAADPHRLEMRDDLKREAKVKFSPYLSDQLCREAWKTATSLHTERSEKGRRTKTPDV